MASRWGVDSASVISPGLASGATYGGNTAFWGRYFYHSSTPGYQFQDGESGTLVANTSNIRWIVPLCSPYYTLSGGSYTDGVNVATAFCNYLRDRLNSGASPKIHLPTLRHDSSGNPIHRVYLNVEPDQPLTQSFWDGWAYTVSAYNYNGVYPFFPCAYINRDALNHCAVVGGNSGYYTCHGIWAQQPQTGPCSIPGPAWGPNDCAGVVGGTKLWQYRINNTCGTNVDFNLSTPAGGDDEAAYMLYIY